MKVPPHVMRAREQHHIALSRMMPFQSRVSGLEVWRKLRRIEAEAHKIGLDMCNTGISEEEKERRDEAVRVKIAAVFGGKLPLGFFINHDPRGYALKLEAKSVPHSLHEDWGGYQILAPEINT